MADETIPDDVRKLAENASRRLGLGKSQVEFSPVDEKAEREAFEKWWPTFWPNRGSIPEIVWQGWLGRAAARSDTSDPDDARTTVVDDRTEVADVLESEIDWLRREARETQAAHEKALGHVRAHFPGAAAEYDAVFEPELRTALDAHHSEIRGSVSAVSTGEAR